MRRQDVHITSEFRKLSGSIKPLVEKIKPELIICYGVRSLERRDWSAFDKEDGSKSYREYDLLIVIGRDQKLQDHELLYRIGSMLSDPQSRFNITLHRLNGVMEALRQGSPFFAVVQKCGRVLYDRNGLWELINSVKSAIDLSKSRSQSEHHFRIAAAFLEGARNYLAFGKYSLAFFMLHQCVEHGCSAVIYARLGYRATTHSLSRLLQLTANFSNELNSIFEGVTKAEQRAFALLFGAYIDSRYDAAFQPTFSETEIVYRRVSHFLEVIRTLLEQPTLEDFLNSEPRVSEDVPKIPYRAIRAVCSAAHSSRQAKLAPLRIACQGQDQWRFFVFSFLRHRHP